LALGRTVIALFFVRMATRPRPVAYEHERGSFELCDSATTQVATRFGKIAFTRPVGRPAGKPRGRRDLPVDRELGLGSGFSVPMTMIVMRLCAQMAFGAARTTFRSIFDWAPSSRTVLRMVDSTGEHAAKFLKVAKAPDDDGEILVIQPVVSLARIKRPSGGSSGARRQADHDARASRQGSRAASRGRRRRWPAPGDLRSV
jgi:hypothetical protein